MIFGPVPVGAAEGAVLAHSVRVSEGRLRKGKVLGAADVVLIVLTVLITMGCAGFALLWLWRRRRSAQGRGSVYHRDGEQMMSAEEDRDKGYNMSNLSIDDDNTTNLNEHDEDDARL